MWFSEDRQACSVEQIGWPPVSDPSPPFFPNPPSSVYDLDLGWEHIWIRSNPVGDTASAGPDRKLWIFITYLDPVRDLVYGCVFAGHTYRLAAIPRSWITMHVPNVGETGAGQLGQLSQGPAALQRAWLQAPQFPPQQGFPQYPGFPGERRCQVQFIGYPPTFIPSLPFIPNPPSNVLELRLGWLYLWLHPRQSGQGGPEGWIYVTYLDPLFDAVIGCIYVGGSYYRRVWIPRRAIYSYIPFG
ncbi:hypothetical protein [Paenibacillus turpanensis]|uniref:hypothetical protein n=1 Tax=Paenibacillus turpanensis TaxID=2689078 RepID=UPI00140E47FC|nr:hypothetical protein [Paenibacillus turpanensis]